jgi:hypothetical protein
MKNLNDDKCILLKKKEYDELIEKANSKKPDYIKLDLGGFFYNGGNINVSENLELSTKLKNQILNILKLYRNKLNKIINDNNNKILKEENYFISLFEKLPWYKRLFFNKKYIKNNLYN